MPYEPALPIDGYRRHTIWDGLAVSSLVGGQRELFISWGNGADKTGILSVTDEEGTEVVRRSLDSENDYTLVGLGNSSGCFVPRTYFCIDLLTSAS